MTEKSYDRFPKGRTSGRSLNCNSEKWCEDCQMSYADGCSEHEPLLVPDQKFLPRAFATLPRDLVVSDLNFDGKRCSTKKTSDGSSKTSEERFLRSLEDGVAIGSEDHGGRKETSRGDRGERNPVGRGVFAKRGIPKRVQFGPMVGKLVEESQESKKQAFKLLLNDVDGKNYRLDASDPETCNWMMFVRPASSSSDQNLVAFQHDRSIFYLSTKNIKAGQELRVWYAKPYAERLGVTLLGERELAAPPDGRNFDNGKETINDPGSGLPRSEFPETFRTEVRSNECHDPDSWVKEVGLQKGRRRLVVRRNGLVKEKNHDDDDFVKYEIAEDEESADDDNDGDGEYHPKRQEKKSWSSLRKNRKKKKKRKKNKSSLVAQCHPEKEQSCQKCELSFKDPFLLDLHALAHGAENAASDVEVPISLAKMFESSEENSLGDAVESRAPSLTTPTCPVCGEEFETRSALVSHVGRHGSNKRSLACPRPFKCQLCLKTFTLFERLQQHLLCHGDESLKPLACEVCSRRFMNPAALAVHMKTHGDRKYYACPLCPESFDQIQLLRAHAEERHLERTMKAFDPTADVGSGRSEVEGPLGSSNSIDAGAPAANSSPFVGDGSCAAVAIATATTAIAGGVWIGAVCPSSSGSEVAMAMEGELEFVGDAGHCLFAEEVTTNDVTSGTDPVDNDLVQLLECSGMNAEVESSAKPGKDPPKRAEGTYHCPECHRVFAEFSSVSRHIRLFHSGRSFECKDCGRKFPRRDKLRLHALRHSSHREFVCETCGRQFKRKDKLRDHLRRQHDPSKENNLSLLATCAKQGNASSPTFTPAISPLDFMKFVFKCQKCLLGFKRRGMLVNHLAKKHPEVPMDSVPELNLPIITSKHDFFCQYCSKVFKSSSKRKFHILKHHPGSELPASLRPNKQQFPRGPITDKSLKSPAVFHSNASFSTPNGHLASEPYPCNMCHRQYSSKSKLLQHQRKKHTASDLKNVESAGVAAESDDVASTVRLPASSDEVPEPSSLEVDYSELFVSAPIFFTSKSSNSLEVAGETELAAAGNVVVLSNEEDLLSQGPTQLNFAKTQNFVSRRADVGYDKAQQTVIINADVFNQAVNELAKSYAGKSSVILAHYDAQQQQQQHFSHNGGHSNVISLAVDNNNGFAGRSHEGTARLIRVDPNSGTTALVASPFVGVIEYDQLCSVGHELSRTSS